MTTSPYMQLYIADYLSDTPHLSTLEHGAYLLLIFAYWQSGKPLPAEPARLARIARLSLPEWQDIHPVLQDFFREEDGKWFHNRIESDLAKYRGKSESASAAGKASAIARKGKSRSANRQPTDNESFNDRSTNAERMLNDRSTTVEKKINESSTNQNQNQNQNNKTPLPPFSASPVDNSESYPQGIAKGDGVGSFDILKFLDYDDALYEQARKAAPGWDIRHLAGIYNTAIHDGQRDPPRNPGAAFVGWCAKYTRGQPPS